MARQQAQDECRPLAGLRHLRPFAHPGVAVVGDQGLQSADQPLRVADEVLVVAHQQFAAHRIGGLDVHTGRPPHRGDQCFGDLTLPDLAAFRLDVDRSGRIAASQEVPEQGLEVLLRGLRLIGQVTEHRAAMPGERLEIEHLRPLSGEFLEQQALAAAGSSGHDPKTASGGPGRQIGDDLTSERPISALEHLHPPADAREDRGQRAGPVAPAPAVDQRLPVAGLVGERALQQVGDVARDQRGAGALGLEGAAVPVQGADVRTLRVVEHRQVDRAGQVVERELAGAAGVDDRAVAIERFDRLIDADALGIAGLGGHGGGRGGRRGSGNGWEKRNGWSPIVVGGAWKPEWARCGRTRPIDVQSIA